MGRPDGRDTVDSILKHYGVKGMRWGFRKNSSGRPVKTGGRVASEDYTQAQALKKRRVSELSNSELRALNERMNLEQNYARLMSNQPNKLAQGIKVSNDILKTAGKVYNFAQSPAGRQVQQALFTKVG